MKFLAIIPARFSSSRFPGKPLVKIGGEEMIVRVCRRVEEAGVKPVVATDDVRIYDCVVNAGFHAVMTSEECGSGTERVAEACEKLEMDADIIINVQGDEPFIRKDQIKGLVDIFSVFPSTSIATLVKRYDPRGGYAGLEDPNLVKVTVSDSGKALYFSRSVIPYVRKAPKEKWPECHEFLTHIGVYAYRRDVLREIVKLPISNLEASESLEQLRWLQAGYEIQTALTEFSTIGIDTPADLEAAEAFLSSIQKQ